MIQIIQSNKLEALVAMLGAQLNVATRNNPFEADIIWVQSPGMSQWLKIKLAEQMGVAANLEFPLPSSYIWQLYQTFLTDVPATSPYNKQQLTWRLFYLLPKLVEDSGFQGLFDYLNSIGHRPIKHNQEQHWQQLNRFQLAAKIADVFDNYLMYRPEWLDHWLLGNNDMPESVFDDQIHQQDWQPKLWRLLVNDIQQQYPNQHSIGLLNRAQLHQALLDKLVDPTSELLAQLPTRIHVFGLSTIPKQQLTILMALAEHIDVTVFWLNPSRMYWGDIVGARSVAKHNVQISDSDEHIPAHFIQGNPLLASWGKVGRDFLDLTTELQIDSLDLFVDNQNNQSLLSQIQTDILNLSYRNSVEPLTVEQLLSDHGIRNIEKTDTSIGIHVCHSPIRELEVLKHALLTRFNNDPELSPKDIIVMVPDIDSYAPHIDSVFGFQADQAELYIPYAIADRTELAEQPILTIYLTIFGLANNRFSVDELYDLLDIEVIATQFNLSAEDIRIAKHWIEQANIKWGIDSDHKQSFDLPPTDLNTWLFGLQQMITDFAIGQNPMSQTDSQLNIEGLNAEIVGKLVNFVSTLVELQVRIQQSLTPHQWQQELNTITEELFSASISQSQVSIAYEKVQSALSSWLQDFDQTTLSQPISYQVIHHFLQQQFNEQGVNQRFLAGSINFCTLMPMRAVPFKQVCILGLNEADYPRRVTPISFDLVSLNPPRKGDRARQHDDKYLFLEAILSARDALHLSYVGLHGQTNQPLNPSSVLQELMDYCDQSFRLHDPEQIESDQTQSVLDQIKIVHKLQPFNRGYFSDSDCSQNALLEYGFDPIWYQVSQTLNSASASQANTEDPAIKLIDPSTIALDQLGCDFDPITIEQLVSFYSEPIKHYFVNTLGIAIDDDMTIASDSEVIDLDGLQKYQLTKQVSQFIQRNPDQKIQFDEWQKGQLPNENWGRQHVEQAYQQAFNQQQQLKQRLGGSLDELRLPIDIDLTVTDEMNNACKTNISGYRQVLAMQPNVSISFRFGDMRPKDYIAGYLQHLVSCVVEPNNLSIWVTKSDKCAVYEPMDSGFAKSTLARFVLVYLQYANTLFPWEPTLALEYVKVNGEGANEVQLKAAIAKQFDIPQFGKAFHQDKYVSRVYQHPSQVDNSFYAMCDYLLKDWQQCVQLVKVDKLDLSHYFDNFTSEVSQ